MRAQSAPALHSNQLPLTSAMRWRCDSLHEINRLRQFRPEFRSNVGLGGCEPWIKIPNLGSHILAIVRRRLPTDWTERYNTTPVLIENFVQTPRNTGAVYRASGWIRVGTTQGRGRYDRHKLYDKPRKDVWLRPLRRNWKRTLNR